jgi:hypothetical protein
MSTRYEERVVVSLLRPRPVRRESKLFEKQPSAMSRQLLAVGPQSDYLAYHDKHDYPMLIIMIIRSDYHAYLAYHPDFPGLVFS